MSQHFRHINRPFFNARRLALGLRILNLSFGLRGPSPQAFTSFGRVGFIALAPEVPQKGNADGTEGIFGTCRMRVGYSPAPRPTIKRPCAILARSVGRATNTTSSRLLAFCEAPGPVLDFGPKRGSGKGTMADLGPLIRHLVSTWLPSGG